MSTSARENAEAQEAIALAMASMRPVAQVAVDLGIRTEVELPRLPGIVEWARSLADALGLTATVEIQADGVCVRFAPL
ncbi:MAG: hypothetical protein U0893_13650 [Chloroflexota bacterium]